MANIAPFRIIGIGSPFGDDQLGWRVITALEVEPLNPNISLARCEAPGSTLLQLMQGAQRVYLIDAVQTGATPGTIQRWQGEEIATAQSDLSSHGIGVASVLALGKALGDLPPDIILYGVEIAMKPITYTVEGKMSAAVENAIPILISMLKKEIETHFL